MIATPPTEDPPAELLLEAKTRELDAVWADLTQAQQDFAELEAAYEAKVKENEELEEVKFRLAMEGKDKSDIIAKQAQMIVRLQKELHAAKQRAKRPLPPGLKRVTSAARSSNPAIKRPRPSSAASRMTLASRST